MFQHDTCGSRSPTPLSPRLHLLPWLFQNLRTRFMRSGFPGFRVSRPLPHLGSDGLLPLVSIWGAPIHPARPQSYITFCIMLSLIPPGRALLPVLPWAIAGLLHSLCVAAHFPSTPLCDWGSPGRKPDPGKGAGRSVGIRIANVCPELTRCCACTLHQLVCPHNNSGGGCYYHYCHYHFTEYYYTVPKC